MMVLCILLAMLSLFLSLKLIYQRKLVTAFSYLFCKITQARDFLQE